MIQTMAIETSDMTVVMVKPMEMMIVVETIAKEGSGEEDSMINNLIFKTHTEYSTATYFVVYMA